MKTKFWATALTILSTMALLFFFVLHAGCSSETTTILKQINNYPEAKQRMDAHIRACGPGVVMGQKGINNCLYQIVIDENFLVPMHRRLGLEKPAGWERDRPWVKINLRDAIAEKVRTLDDWDWTRERDGICPTKNQGSCGSCWFFSTQSVFRAHWALRNEGECLDVSSQWGIDCSPRYSGCRGGFWNGAKFKVGPIYTPNYGPYLARNRRCKKDLLDNDTEKAMIEDAYIGEDDNKYPTTFEILIAIYKYGPVSITERGFNAGSSGLYSRCGGGSTTHMTQLHGFTWRDDEGNKTKAGEGTLYFYRHNSWANQGPIEGQKIVKATKYKGFDALDSRNRCQSMGRTVIAITEPGMNDIGIEH